MMHNNGDGGAHARPAILSPAAHASQSLLDELLLRSRGEITRLSARAQSYAKAQSFQDHRRMSHD
jgi:hypothetical protein